MAIIPGRWFAAGLVASVVVIASMMAQAGLKIEISTVSTAVFAALGILAASLRYQLRSPATPGQRIARDLAEYVGMFGLICLLGAVASYPAAAASTGFIDPSLERIDRMLRFNWIGWYDVVARHSSLQALGALAYASIYVTPAVLLGYFAISGRRAQARLFVASFWLAAAMTLILFPFFPAEGPLAFLWHGPIPYMPTSALYQSALIPALREHAVHDINLGALRGLVCAPSFHTTSAVLYIATAWRIERLRWPLTVINVAMLLATPVEGTHYLTDMIGGALVAVTALAAVSALVWALSARRAHAETAHDATLSVGNRR